MGDGQELDCGALINSVLRVNLVFSDIEDKQYL